MLRAAFAILIKDLRIEARTREILLASTFFALLVATICSLSFYMDSIAARNVAPGVLYTALAFSSILAISRNWAREREHDALRGLLLAPAPRFAVYLGKAASTLLFLVGVELALVPAVAILYRVDLLAHGPLPLWILALATLGTVLTGTLFGAMTVRTSARDLMLSVVLFPLLLPVLLASVVATREALAGNLSEVSAWIRVLLAYDLAMAAAAAVLFEGLVGES